MQQHSNNDNHENNENKPLRVLEIAFWNLQSRKSVREREQT